VGPLDFNMAGQPPSLVDFSAPDFDHFPKFAGAFDAAHAGDHIPERARSVLGPPSEERICKILSFVMTRLSQR
jgi:hypothetical protein